MSSVFCKTEDLRNTLNLASSILLNIFSEISVLQSPRNLSEFCVVTTGTEDVTKFVSQSATKSYALDETNTGLSKLCIESLLPYLIGLHIVNLSLQPGEFPTQYEAAMVTSAIFTAIDMYRGVHY